MIFKIVISSSNDFYRTLKLFIFNGPVGIARSCDGRKNTRGYEKVLSRSQNCCSVKEADFSCGGRLFQHVGPVTAKLYVGRSWQSWCVGSAVHYEPLIVADDYECRPTAGRTSMPGMVVPSGVDI